jgi:WD40 repeat protein
MNETRDLLERVGDRFAFPSGAFERLEHRRDRKRRNRRIAAGVAGIAIFAALVFGLARATLGGSGSLPAVPDQSPSPSIQTEGLPPIIGDNEVVTGDRGPLQAFDRTTGERRTLVTCQDPCVTITGYALSADRRWLAYELYTCGPRASEPCEPEGGIWVTNALGEHTQLTHSCRPEACYRTIWAWSPVGATLAVGDAWDPTNLFTIDPQSGERTQIANDDNVTAFAWSRDGNRVAYAASAIHVVEVPTGRSTTLSDALGSVDTMAWSPDGSGLLVDSFARGHVLLTVLDTDGSDQRTLLEAAPGEGPGAPAWSPDGNRIAYATQPQKKGATGGHYSFEVWVIGADSSDPTRIFAGECCIGDWDGPIWSPDGERLAFFDDADMSYGTWLVANADGSGEPQQISEIEARSWGQE